MQGIKPGGGPLTRNRFHGPLARYVRWRVVHERGMPGTFSPPLTSNETVSKRPQHGSRHLHHARAMMHVGTVTRSCGINVPGIPGAWANRKFMYLARGPCPDFIYAVPLPSQPLWPSVHRMAQTCSVHQMSLVVVSRLWTSWRSRRYQGLRRTSFGRCAGQSNRNPRTGSFF